MFEDMIANLESLAEQDVASEYVEYHQLMEYSNDSFETEDLVLQQLSPMERYIIGIDV